MQSPLLPTGMQFPLGTKMVQPTPQFPPDLTAKLEEAKRSGRYFIIVVTATEAGDLTTFANRTEGKTEFKIDWLLRSYVLIWSVILSLAAKAMQVTQPPLDPQPEQPAEVERVDPTAETQGG